MNREVEWQFLVLRTQIFRAIDAKADKALALIKALGERNRRGIGQLTRFDRVQRRINK